MAPSPDRFHQRLSGVLFAKIFLHLEHHSEQGEVYQAPFDVQLPGQNVDQPVRLLKAGQRLSTELLPRFELPVDRLFG